MRPLFPGGRSVVALALLMLTLLVPRAAWAGPQRTTVGVYVTQVNSVDLKSNSFTIDFWLWFRFAPTTGPSPLDTFELIDGKVNSKTYVIKKPLPSGEQYAAARINATIHRQWDLHRYPFDDHDLEIVLEDSDLDADRAVFVSDAHSQGIDPAVQVSGWTITGFESEITDHLYHSNYGDTSMATDPETHFSRYVARVHAKREGLARFLKVVFPLIVAVIAAWCGFFIRPKDASPRVSVSIGALFAAAAATIAIGSQLPDINYVTVSDKTVFLGLGMIGASLLCTVASLSLHYNGRENDHRRLDRIGALLYPIVYVLGMALVAR